MSHPLEYRSKPCKGIPTVYLAYLDDSGTKQKDLKHQVLSGVVISDANFIAAEMLAGVLIEDLLPADRLEKFEEFHAWELYGGYGIFEGIEQRRGSMQLTVYSAT